MVTASRSGKWRVESREKDEGDTRISSYLIRSFLLTIHYSLAL
jgi:hypothetical protein